ncbi:protein GVQW3-like [Lycorma delicatula]|uniref:protein GVQW3-like n=1 Tax=Lycorma delicatula TaxID=130591 RepID=UPI003F50DD6E
MQFLRATIQRKILHETEETFTKTFQLLKQAYRDDAQGCTQCYEWFSQFKSGYQSNEDEPQPRRHSTSTHVQKINNLVGANHQLIVRELISLIGSCHDILTEKMNMHQAAAKFVLHLMTKQQKEHQVDIC